MKKRWRIFTALCFMFTALIFLAGVPGASADSIQDQINALKAEVAKLEGQQMDLQKQATEAAAALPNFSYRAGSGILIEAADKSWSFRNHLRFHHHLVFQEGKDQAGRTNGEVFARRVRPTWYYCLNNCFYEAEVALDLDGFNTSSTIQRATAYINFGNIHPWLPSFYFGADAPSDINAYTQGSSNTAAQLEYDLLRRNNGFNTGSMGNGLGFRWEDAPLSSIGIPGKMRLNFAVGSVGSNSDGASRFSDHKDYVAYMQIEPFTEVKNKWLSGFGFSMGAWFCNNDDRDAKSRRVTDTATDTGSTATRVTDVQPGADNGCSRLRIRDNGPGGRQALFDTGSGSIGRGMAHFLTPGVGYRVGPYSFRATMGFQNYQTKDNGASDRKGRGFLIAHELYVYSPKGFLTGSSSTAGSILLGTHFERTDVWCGHAAGTTPCASGGEFSRNRILLREWDMFYVIQRGMNVGISVIWYDASNLLAGTAARRDRQVQANILDKPFDQTRPGAGGDWVDVMLAFRWQF